ncbi:hypothetical protein [Proteiniclasticum ruminis]|uniref:Uncharacterized protein n=1 Tax=Proteiniclasticum ruminis TaxID=398199 RepID=A0A1I5EUB3_9CLOT|nr:hypothetical protein [Proteiniclasticum ruminis]SFO15029.1 hypothetical protein SAMN04488695_12115 [Proteiniclasticum ruminis]
MKEYSAFKYTINLSDAISADELLNLLSTSIEDGVLNIKVVQGKKRIVIYSLTRGFPISKYGDIIGDIEPVIYYRMDEFDDFNMSIKSKLYSLSEESYVESWIEII